MLAAPLQSKIWKGYGKAAKHLGDDYSFFRPPGADKDWNDAFGAQGTRRVSLNAEDMAYKRPRSFGKATWYALFDATGAAVGDYFTGQAGIFYVAGIQRLLPILVVQCNQVINVYRPQQQTATGMGGYGGTTNANMTLLLKSRACSILQGTKGERSEANLPGDTRAAWWEILLPASGVTIRPNDIIIDQLQRRYVVSSPELSSLGWRMTAMMALT